MIDALPAELRRNAFTHSAWAARPQESYERLEFLGDGVLGLAVAEHLFRRFPERREGDLAQARAHAVSRQSCAQVALGLGLEQDLREQAERLGVEDWRSVASSRTVLAALVEAAIGAAFLHFGLERVAAAVVDAFADAIRYALEEHVDFKTVLQEELARRAASVTYSLVETSGPPHERTFTSSARVGDVELGSGSGRSKKASEQAAAREALGRLDELSPGGGPESEP